MATNKKIGVQLLEDDLVWKITNSLQMKEVTIDMLSPALRAEIESKKVEDGFDATPIYTALDSLEKTKADIDLLKQYFNKDTDKVTGSMVDDTLLSTIAQSAASQISGKLNGIYRQLADSITMSDLGKDVTDQLDAIKKSISKVSSESVSADQLTDISDQITALENTIADVNTTASDAQDRAQNAIDGQTEINNSIDKVTARLASLENTAMIKDTTVLMESQLPPETKAQLSTMATQIAKLQALSEVDTDKAVSATLTPAATNSKQEEEIKADKSITSYYYIDIEQQTITHNEYVLYESADSSTDTDSSAETEAEDEDIASDETTDAIEGDSSETTEDVYKWKSTNLGSSGVGFILDNKFGRIFYNHTLVGGYPFVVTSDITLKANESQTVDTTEWFSDCLANRPIAYIQPDTSVEEYIPATLYVTTFISADGFKVTNNTDETLSIKVIVKGVCR